MRRLFTLLLTLLLIFAATRALVRFLPGDPLETLMAETGTSVPPEVLRAELGLDRPWLASLPGDVWRAAHGDWGSSLVSRRPVAPLLARRVSRTLGLTGFALLIAIPFSLLIGLAAARFPAGIADRLCSALGAVAAALPSPWLGPLLILLLSVWIPLFPPSGNVALPALTLSVGIVGFWSRLIRERTRDVLRFGAAPGARARGVPEWKVVLKYGLAPAGGALLSIFGMQLGHWFAGAAVIEVIFEWKGLGSLLVDSVLRRDYPMLEGAAFAAALFVLLGNALGDFLQRRWDPR